MICTVETDNGTLYHFVSGATSRLMRSMANDHNGYSANIEVPERAKGIAEKYGYRHEPSLGGIVYEGEFYLFCY